MRAKHHALRARKAARIRADRALSAPIPGPDTPGIPPGIDPARPPWCMSPMSYKAMITRTPTDPAHAGATTPSGMPGSRFGGAHV